MDLLLNRYNNIDFINNLSFDDGIKLIFKAHEKREEDKAFALYTARFVTMDKESFMEFKEFYNPKINKNVESDKPIDDILSEVKEILDNFKKERSE